MKLVHQLAGAPLCGQCCVAMVVGRPVREVIVRIGHAHATSTRELVAALRSYGFTCPDKLQRIAGAGFPPLCIVKERHRGRSGWHWVVFGEGRIFDPDIASRTRWDGQFSSCLPIQLPAPDQDQKSRTSSSKR